MKASSSAKKDRIVIPGRVVPLTTFFLVVPALVTIVIGIVLMKYKLPLHLMALLTIVAGSCLFLIKEAVAHVGPITIEVTDQELIVTRLIGSESYSWSNIESVKLYDPGATFSDCGRNDDGRAAIGLFIRDPDKKDREIDAEPDVMVISRGGEEITQILKAQERIANGKKNAGRGGRGAAMGKQTKSFRRSGAAATATPAAA